MPEEFPLWALTMVVFSIWRCVVALGCVGGGCGVGGCWVGGYSVGTPKLVAEEGLWPRCESEVVAGERSACVAQRSQHVHH